MIPTTCQCRSWKIVVKAQVAGCPPPMGQIWSEFPEQSTSCLAGLRAFGESVNKVKFALSVSNTQKQTSIALLKIEADVLKISCLKSYLETLPLEFQSPYFALFICSGRGPLLLSDLWGIKYLKPLLLADFNLADMAVCHLPSSALLLMNIDMLQYTISCQRPASAEFGV